MGVDTVLAVVLVLVSAVPLNLVEAVFTSATNGVRELDELEDILLLCFVSIAAKKYHGHTTKHLRSGDMS